jgi:23S rRNA (adenine2503-C2)-methyltransferase
MADMWNEIKKIDSSNLDVSKYVFEKPDAVAEAVLYKYPTYKERTVICCSTQSGCPVGCRFCGAGDNFVRSLTGKEIHQQVWHLSLARRFISRSGTSYRRLERTPMRWADSRSCS